MHRRFDPIREAFRPTCANRCADAIDSAHGARADANGRLDRFAGDTNARAGDSQ